MRIKPLPKALLIIAIVATFGAAVHFGLKFANGGKDIEIASDLPAEAVVEVVDQPPKQEPVQAPIQKPTQDKALAEANAAVEEANEGAKASARGMKHLLNTK